MMKKTGILRGGVILLLIITLVSVVAFSGCGSSAQDKVDALVEKIETTVDTTKVDGLDEYLVVLEGLDGEIDALPDDAKELWASDEGAQAAEQKLDGEITRVEGLIAAQAAAQKEVDDLEAEIDAAIDATKAVGLDAYLEGLEELSGKIDALSERATALWDSAYTTKLNNEITRVTTAIEEAKGDVTKLKADITGAIKSEAVDKDTAGLDEYLATLEGLKADVEGLSATAKEYWDADTDATAVATALDTEIGEVKDAIAQRDAQNDVDALVAAINAAIITEGADGYVDISSGKTAVDTYLGALKNLQAKYTSDGDDVDGELSTYAKEIWNEQASASDTNDVKTAKEKLEAEITRVEGILTTAQGEVTALVTEITGTAKSDTMSGLDAYLESLKGIRDKIANEGGSVDGGLTATARDIWVEDASAQAAQATLTSEISRVTTAKDDVTELINEINSAVVEDSGNEGYIDENDNKVDVDAYLEGLNEKKTQVPTDEGYTGTLSATAQAYWKEASGSTEAASKLDAEITRVSGLITTAEQAVSTLTGNITSALETGAGGEDESSLTTYLGTLNGFKTSIDGLSTLARDIWDADEDAQTAVAALDEEIAEVTAAIEEAKARAEIKAIIEEIDSTVVAGTSTGLDEYLGKLKAIQEKINGTAAEGSLSEKAREIWQQESSVEDLENDIYNANKKLADEITTIENLIAQAKDEAKAVSDRIEETIKSEYNTTDHGEYADLKAYYDAVTALTYDINGLSDAAKEYFEAEDYEYANEDDVTAELTRLENLVVERQLSDVAIGEGTSGTFYLIRKYINVLGEGLDYTKTDDEYTGALTLSYKIDDGDAKTDVTFSYDAENGAYVAKITFDPSTATKIEYTVSVGSEPEETVTKDFNAFIENVTVGDGVQLFTDGTITITRGVEENEDPIFADMYLTDSITVAGDDSKTVTVSHIPLLSKIPVEEEMKEADFKKVIGKMAPQLVGKTTSVNFVFYSYAEDGESKKITQSQINGDSVCEDYSLEITEEDVKEKMTGSIFDIGVWPGSGNFSLIDNGLVANFIAQFNTVLEANGEELRITTDNAIDYLEIIITATDNDKNSEKLFSEAVPFKNQGYTYSAYMSDWAAYYHSQSEHEDGKTYNFSLHETIVLKDLVEGTINPLSKYFLKEGPTGDIRKENDYTGTVTFNKSDVIPTSDAQVSIDDRHNSLAFPSFTVANDILAGYVDYVEVRFRKASDPEETCYTAYLTCASTNDAYLYDSLEDLRTGSTDQQVARHFGRGGNEYWTSVGEVNNWIKDHYSVSDFDYEGAWYFQTFVVRTFVGHYLFDATPSEWVTFNDDLKSVDSLVGEINDKVAEDHGSDEKTALETYRDDLQELKGRISGTAGDSAETEPGLSEEAQALWKTNPKATAAESALDARISEIEGKISELGE